MRLPQEKVIRTEKRPATKFAHATLVRVTEREIHSYLCDDKKCRFYGKRSQQGVCHTTPAEIAQEKQHRYAIKAARDRLAHVKKYKGSQKDYARSLEIELWCEVVNGAHTLQELVLLRGRVAELEDELKTRKASKSKPAPGATKRQQRARRKFLSDAAKRYGEIPQEALDAVDREWPERG